MIVSARLPLGDDGRLFVDTAQPVVYWRLGHAYIGGRWLPQFTYTACFAPQTLPRMSAGQVAGAAS